MQAMKTQYKKRPIKQHKDSAEFFKNKRRNL